MITTSPKFDAIALLNRFRSDFSRDDAVAEIAAGLIGKEVVLDGPFGPRPMLYADYVASGRPVRQVEDFIAEHVLPYYANTHTLASFCGGYSTSMRAAARDIIARLCGADDRYAVLFTGSGATAGLNRLVTLLGADVRNERAGFASLFNMGRSQRALVIIGPYEHHSNILPWRESGAEVVEIGEAPEGGPDRDELRRVLSRAHLYTRTICAFSAASNITGLMADVPAITRIVKAAGALMLWDYAGGAPYLPISMCPEPDAEIDAIALSPHKFVGGPGASGITIVRRDAVAITRPVMPGGGTVAFVSPTAHDYIGLLEEREEGGTPDYIGDVRAALAFLVKDAADPVAMTGRQSALSRRALDAWGDIAGLEILGPTHLPRLPIFSFMVRDPDGNVVESELVARILSDEFGIQARSGCACAGPYAHRLLGIGEAQSEALRREILAGDTSNKPGFTRLNLSPFMSADKIDFIIETVAALPDTVQRLQNRYRFDAEQNLFEAIPGDHDIRADALTTV